MILIIFFSFKNFRCLNIERCYSRLVVLEAGKIVQNFVAEVKILHPKGLALPEDGDVTQPTVKGLYELLAWAEGMVCCSPERHSVMSSILKALIDWIKLKADAIHATQDQASGES